MVESLRIYFDTCVWCRPFDEQREEIIRETKAIEAIFDFHDRGGVEIVGSVAVLAEVGLISDERKRRAVEGLIKTISDYIVGVSKDVINLAEKIKDDCGLRDVDALHVALACEHADVFVTVDKGILKKGDCLQKYIIVVSPVDFNELYGRSVR